MAALRYQNKKINKIKMKKPVKKKKRKNREEEEEK